MKYVRGFLMAWGCFCWIPCPYKKWKEEDRPAMLAMLPLVGTMMGIIVSLAWIGLLLAGVGSHLVAAIVTVLCFLITGFIHLDGYMDCSDAVLPRHPDMKRRREILKDPHNGAFGIIALGMMLLIFVASAFELSDSIISEEGVVNWNIMIVLPVIMTASRSISVQDVASCEPMETSQYADMRGHKWKVIVPAAITVAIVIVLGGVFDMMAAGSFGFQFQNVVLAMLVTMIAAYITGYCDRKSLGGMNGDISGHMIVTSETSGLLAAAVVISIV